MSELRSAAEDILNKWEENKGSSPISVLANGAIALARGYLADHPADADDPITPEWLEQQPGWKVFGDEISWWATKELAQFNHYPQLDCSAKTELKLYDYGVLIISQGPDESIVWTTEITTRGQLRGLLKEMGGGG